MGETIYLSTGDCRLSEPSSSIYIIEMHFSRFANQSFSETSLGEDSKQSSKKHFLHFTSDSKPKTTYVWNKNCKSSNVSQLVSDISPSVFLPWKNSHRNPEIRFQPRSLWSTLRTWLFSNQTCFFL